MLEQEGSSAYTLPLHRQEMPVQIQPTAEVSGPSGPPSLLPQWRGGGGEAASAPILQSNMY